MIMPAQNQRAMVGMSDQDEQTILEFLKTAKISD
jgi:hypothetical protein